MGLRLADLKPVVADVHAELRDASRRHFLLHDGGRVDIISVPPATTRSSMPDMICAAARLTAVMPPPQKRGRASCRWP